MLKTHKRKTVKKGRKTFKLQKGAGRLLSLPVPESIGPARDEFRSTWDHWMIMAHGEILTSEFPIPENTFIIFNSPAGCKAVSMGPSPYPEVLVAENHNDFINKFSNEHVVKSGLLKTFASAANKNRVLAGNSCFPPGFFNVSPDPLAQSTYAECMRRADPRFSGRTIYNNENVPDILLTFKNNLYESLLLGVYKLPLSMPFFRSVAEAMGTLQESRMGFLQGQSDATKDAIKARHTKLTEEKDKELFVNKDVPKSAARSGGPRIAGIRNVVQAKLPTENTRPDYITKKMLLSQVIRELPPVPEGKNRFIFVGACRGYGLRELNLVEPNIRKAHTERLRRRSLGPLSNEDQRRMHTVQTIEELARRFEAVNITSGAPASARIPGAGGPASGAPASGASASGALASVTELSNNERRARAAAEQLAAIKARAPAASVTPASASPASATPAAPAPAPAEPARPPNARPPNARPPNAPAPGASSVAPSIPLTAEQVRQQRLKRLK